MCPRVCWGGSYRVRAETCRRGVFGGCWHLRTQPFEHVHTFPGVKWTSGARFSQDTVIEQVAADYVRRLLLRANASLPLVFLDVGINGQRVGRCECVLWNVCVWGGGCMSAAARQRQPAADVTRCGHQRQRVGRCDCVLCVRGVRGERVLQLRANASLPLAYSPPPPPPPHSQN